MVVNNIFSLTFMLSCLLSVQSLSANQDPFASLPLSGQNPFASPPPTGQDSYVPSNTEISQALTRLNLAEGSQRDANEDLEIITRARRSNEALMDVTDTFIYILWKSGGRSKTKTAQQAFKVIDKNLRPQDSRRHAAESYVMLLNAESDASDAIRYYRRISESLGSYQDLRSEVGKYIQILNQPSTANNSARAWDLYQKFRL